MKRLPVTWHEQVSCLREILASTNLETQEMSHASVRTPEKCPFLTEEETEAESSGDRPAVPHTAGDRGQADAGGLSSGLRHPTLVLLLPEDPGESGAFLQDRGAHPIPAGSVFIPLAFKLRNFYQKQAHAERSHVCHDGKLPHQASEV